ncbi:L,D-transpeptidase [Clostridium swellfunianum]|uniref:L,D-transpeptidase n=1 Tax=Clostridium swellfunianum TaxID=1367462 RepID=UPI002030621F|nr:L,D-transpeptidase [Clostridium swellfunianum]MCM0649935.1 L,D-transpeptidase [Clostridium swellfunianum]
MLIRFPEGQELYRASRYSVTVNTAAKRMTLFKDGTIFKIYPIAIGKPSTPTPKGNFKIINKAYQPGGPFGARWLGLNAPNGDYGIHGTNNPSSIGKAVSNGCIRTYNNNIIELYNLVPVGTPVKII